MSRTESKRHSHVERPQEYHFPMWLVFCGFLLIAGFFLWKEHRAHLLGVLPWLLFLLCPLMHLFMHRHHGSAHGDKPYQHGGK